MRAFGHRLLLACVCLLPLRLAQAASFDCTQARSPVERMICSDAALSELDDRLASAYTAAISADASPQIRAAQRNWMVRRDRCDAPSCVREAYERRLSELAGGAPTPDDARAADSASPGVVAEGKYCVFGPGNSYDMLLARQGPNGSLAFGLMSWLPDGSNFSVGGTARRVGPGWRYEEGMESSDPIQRCAVTIDRAADGTYRVATVEGARCEAYAGHNAVLYGTDVFPPASRVGHAPASFTSEALMQIGCDRPGKSGRPRH